MDKHYWEAISYNFPSQYQEFEVWLDGQYATSAWWRDLFAGYEGMEINGIPATCSGITFYDLPEMMQAVVVFDFFKEKQWEMFPADISDPLEVVQSITDSFGKKFLETLYD